MNACNDRSVRPEDPQRPQIAGRRRRQPALHPALRLVWACVVAQAGAAAQQPASPKTLWYTYVADHPVARGVEVHFDGSYRPTIGSPARQWMLRPGANVALTDRLQLSLTYSYFDTHPLGLDQDDGETREQRMHQQIEYSVPWRRTVFRHRFRMEERWLSSPSHDGKATRWRWQDRPRYMLRWDRPLPLASNGFAPVVTVYDEVLFSFASPSASGFEQNRLYTGIRWKLGHRLSVETGAMHQAVKTTAGAFRHNLIILLALRNNMPLRELMGRFRRD